MPSCNNGGRLSWHNASEPHVLHLLLLPLRMHAGGADYSRSFAVQDSCTLPLDTVGCWHDLSPYDWDGLTGIVCGITQEPGSARSHAGG